MALPKIANTSSENLISLYISCVFIRPHAHVVKSDKPFRWGEKLSDPLLLKWIGLNPAGMNNHMQRKVWYEITHPPLNINDAAWISKISSYTL